MNDVISWLATNNILLVRIGFSAVAVLVVAYVFRLFFMPRDVEKVAGLESSTLSAASSMNIEELAEMQAEIDNLKEKLKLFEIGKVSLQKQPQDQLGDAETTAVSKTDVTQKAAPQVTDSASTGAPESVKEMSLEKSQLLEKIQQLEARLVEYEIIAEDIAEVAQLKSENVELKIKIEKINLQTNLNVTEAVTAVEKPSTDEIFLEEAPPATQAHDTAASDAEIDAMLQESLASPESDPATTATESASQIIITSELEVSEEEQKIIDDFEMFQNRKKG